MTFLKKLTKKFLKPQTQESPEETVTGATKADASAAPKASERRSPRKRSANQTAKANARRPSKSSDKRPHRDAKAPRAPRAPQNTPLNPGEFGKLGLSDQILRALAEKGYDKPTPIQLEAIPSLIEGRDLFGCAQTGTGKTAAFALPSLERLSRSKTNSNKIRILVLTPTRELALQVGESYQDYGKHLRYKTAIVFGGVNIERQKRTLQQGVDILVATPGRLLDLSNQGFVDLTNLEILVLDEADRMLDMGFLPDVKRILKLLKPVRQNILFSATIPSDIEALSRTLLKDPVKVEVAPVSSTSDQVEQSLYYVGRDNKRSLLLDILQDPTTTRVLVFTRTKAMANRIVKFLSTKRIGAEAIHGNKSQSARQRALENFKSGETRVLVASDLAARGLDVDVITHVINFDLPNIPETYVHRIGRTGRASAIGKAISFSDAEEQAYVHSIEKTIGKSIPVVTGHPYELNARQMEEGKKAGPPKQGSGGRGQRRPTKAGATNSHRRNKAKPANSRRRPSSKRGSPSQ